MVFFFWQALLLLLCYVGIGSCQVLTAHPANFTPGYTKSLEIDCNIKVLMHAVTQVFVLQIDREESGNLIPLATVSPAGVTIDALNRGGHFSAVGTISDLNEGPYLNLTISEPDENDQGHYVCVASITDKTMTLAKLTYDLTISKKDLTEGEMTDLIFTLSRKLDGVEVVNINLLNTITLLEQQNRDLLQNITSISDENESLKTNSTSLEHRLATLEQDLEQEKVQNNGSDSQVLTRILDLENQISGLNGSSGVVTVVTNCSCDDTFKDIANDVQKLQMDQFNLQQSFQDSVTNQSTLESDLVAFNNRLDLAEIRVNDLENSTSSQDSELLKLENSLNKVTQEPQVFTARRPSYSAFYPNVTIKGDVGDLTFNSIELDNYQAFNQSRGELTITRAGHYMITLTISIDMVTASAAEAGIKVNGRFICFVSTTSTGILNSGSTTIVADLSVGDKLKASIAKIIAPPLILNPEVSTLSVLYVG